MHMVEGLVLLKGIYLVISKFANTGGAVGGRVAEVATDFENIACTGTLVSLPSPNPKREPASLPRVINRIKERWSLLLSHHKARVYWLLQL